MRTSVLPYPQAAVACVLCRAVASAPSSYLLIRRGKQPSRGRWSLPGGRLELGETTLAGALREVEEETGLGADALKLHPFPITSTDAIHRSGEGNLEFDYRIAQVFAWVREPDAAKVRAGDDALDARWFSLRELDGIGMGAIDGHARKLGWDDPKDGTLAGNVRDVIGLAESMHAAGLLPPPPCAA